MDRGGWWAAYSPWSHKNGTHFSDCTKTTTNDTIRFSLSKYHSLCNMEMNRKERRVDKEDPWPRWPMLLALKEKERNPEIYWRWDLWSQVLGSLLRIKEKNGKRRSASLLLVQVSTWWWHSSQWNLEEDQPWEQRLQAMCWPHWMRAALEIHEWRDQA